MMKTLGTNREAQIILEDGSLSKKINLERGQPQGDSPSPRQYNIGQQICLLKLEFDPRIERLNVHNSVELPQQRFQNSLAINSEVAKGLGCTNCFADDTNAACRQKAASIRAIRDILVEFAGISGLNCNIEKTCIMFNGS